MCYSAFLKESQSIPRKYANFLGDPKNVDFVYWYILGGLISFLSDCAPIPSVLLSIP